MHLGWPALGENLVLIGILVVLEGLLSADNALVLAVIVTPLPREQQRQALRYGILGAFVLRIIATLLAVSLAQVTWIKLVGGLYLLYLPFKHFTQHPDEHPGEFRPAMALRGMLGLSLFWSIVVKADLVDLVFAVDSILAAVALTQNRVVIIIGGLLGILMMRLLTLQVLALVERYPKLIDGAYVIVAWVGVKLLWDYGFAMGLIARELPEWASILIVVGLFLGSLVYAWKQKGMSPGFAGAVTGAGRLLAAHGSGPAGEDDGEDLATDALRADPLLEGDAAPFGTQAGPQPPIVRD